MSKPNTAFTDAQIHHFAEIQFALIGPYFELEDQVDLFRQKMEELIDGLNRDDYSVIRFFRRLIRENNRRWYTRK